MSRRRTRIEQRLARRMRLMSRKLRWAIKISAPEGPTGDFWGDVAFADDLATALRRLGQSVRIDRLNVQADPAGPWDDVVLWLRGLATPEPVPNTVSMLWVISHPELVSDAELSMGWHQTYAASLSWASQKANATQAAVQPLLQAVSRDRFSPVGPAQPHEVLFVGTTRGVERPVVLDAVRTGLPIEIYGHGWGGIIDDALIKADHLSFTDVPAAYRGAHRVLNDHWEDMRRDGFYSNRLFDAVASGARVVSDNIDGLDLLFGPMVQTYDDNRQLAALLTDNALWPDQDTRQHLAFSVLEKHSFDARAKVLLDDALSAFGKNRR